MAETMGQIIRRLRKEKGFTQEELAEQLGITFQAVSKWENGTGMPDISQVVPIARLLGVSTDTLFGVSSSNDPEEISKIMKEAQSFISKPLTTEKLLKKYRTLQEGIKQHPNNISLLLQCLETGLPLAYPESPEDNALYCVEHAETIYHECTQYARCVITYSKNISDTMRAHMIMVMLHSAHGNFSKAKFHVEQFPYRADFNIHVMYGYYAHWKKDPSTEAASHQFGIMHYLEAMLNALTKLAQTYSLLGSYRDAVETLETALSLTECVFSKDEIKPPIHHREQGDLYMLLAEIHLNQGDRDSALRYLAKMVEYDTETYKKIQKDTKTSSPLLAIRPHEFYIKRTDRYQETVAKLSSSCFDSLKEDAEYQKLLELASK